MVKWIKVFKQLRSKHILVLGDFILDTYTFGLVSRISPEAPVPILKVEKESSFPGGAGNVVLNLLSLGCTVIPVGRVGKDREGDNLLDNFREQGINHHGLFQDNSYITPKKNRIISDNQQMIRIDNEQVTKISPKIEDKILSFIKEHIHEVKVLAISDYAKGTLTNSLIRSVVSLAKEYSIPVLIDPKGKDFSKYKGCTLIKPNLKEAQEASGLEDGATSKEIASKLFEITNCEQLIITLSQQGISLFSSEGNVDNFSVQMKDVMDVTGAGDTVFAILCMGIANRVALPLLIPIANIAAGIAIEQLGCFRVSLSDIADRLVMNCLSSKVFDESNLFPFRELIKKHSCIIFQIEEEPNISDRCLFRTIMAIKNVEKKKKNDCVY